MLSGLLLQLWSTYLRRRFNLCMFPEAQDLLVVDRCCLSFALNFGLTFVVHVLLIVQVRGIAAYRLVKQIADAVEMMNEVRHLGRLDAVCQDYAVEMNAPAVFMNIWLRFSDCSYSAGCSLLYRWIVALLQVVHLASSPGNLPKTIRCCSTILKRNNLWIFTRLICVYSTEGWIFSSGV